jgi:16S rRNA (adenine1518-N6/adenine1519-N6)-dimethyltransferase
LARTLEPLLRRAFASRRKMLRNTLAGLLPEAELAALAAETGIALTQRPQELDPRRWVALAAGLNRRSAGRGERPV